LSRRSGSEAHGRYGDEGGEEEAAVAGGGSGHRRRGRRCCLVAVGGSKRELVAALLFGVGLCNRVLFCGLIGLVRSDQAHAKMFAWERITRSLLYFLSITVSVYCMFQR
jgi:hypothetical protein